jgi:UDP-2-acetamido-2,6-beta-L-arabino-hexul-4-ose reductase
MSSMTELKKIENVLVTGADGFIGKNLVAGLNRIEDIQIYKFDIADSTEMLKSYLKDADLVFHLAGVNRPEHVEEFEKGNVSFTQKIIDILTELGRFIPIVYTTSIQARLDNPYGISKKKAEEILIKYNQENNTKVYLYRLPNVFGKWSRPNYNSVVATFCYNISHGLGIQISDAENEIELVYIDDVVDEFARLISARKTDLEKKYHTISNTYRITLGDLAEKIYFLRDIRKTLLLPDFNVPFMKCLYATYLSFLDKDDFSYKLEQKKDQRGSLVEILKSPYFGQIFISTSNKGIMRGNHYHDTKIEKFCVIKGDAAIKLRPVIGNEIITYHVSGDEIEIVDIPPGYTHSIENKSNEDLIVLFWADEIFNPKAPDTYFEKVQHEKN